MVIQYFLSVKKPVYFVLITGEQVAEYVENFDAIEALDNTEVREKFY